MGIYSDIINSPDLPDGSTQEDLIQHMKDIGIDVPLDMVDQTLAECRGEFHTAFARLMEIYVPKVSSSSPAMSPSSSIALNRKRQLNMTNREMSKKRRDSLQRIRPSSTTLSYISDEVADVTERENTVKILCRAVEQLNSNVPLNSSENQQVDWREQFCMGLDLPITNTILLELTNLCTSIAAFRDAHLAIKEKFHILRVCSEIVTELAAFSPTTVEKQVRHPTPSDETIDSHKLNVKELTFESPDAEAPNSSFAPQKVVNCVKNMCEAYVARIDWGENTQEAKKLQLAEFESVVQTIIQKKRQQARDWSANATIAREKLASRDTQIHEFEEQLQQMVAAHAYEHKMEIKEHQLPIAAFLDVLQSSRPDVLGLISSRESHKLNLEKERKIVIKSEKHGDFIGCCDRLFFVVSKERKANLEEDLESFLSTKTKSDVMATEGLINAIPTLCNSLHRFGQYFHKRWKISESKLAERRHELEEHKELFGDEAPQERKQLEVRVREYQNISLNCCTALQQMASAQATFWSNCYSRLPESVCTVLISQFRVLYEKQGASAFKEMLGNFLAINAPNNNPTKSISHNYMDKKTTVVFSNSEVNKGGEISHERGDHLGNLDDPMDESADNLLDIAEIHQNSTVSKDHSVDSRGSLVPGTPIVTRFKVGANNKYVRGVVAKCLENGFFNVEYSDGDIHENIERRHLLTKSDLLKHVSDGFNMDAALVILRDSHDSSSPMDYEKREDQLDRANNPCSVM